MSKAGLRLPHSQEHSNTHTIYTHIYIYNIHIQYTIYIQNTNTMYKCSSSNVYEKEAYKIPSPRIDSRLLASVGGEDCLLSVVWSLISY